MSNNFKNKEHTQRQREIALNQWQDEDFKTKMKMGLKRRWENIETRSKYLAGLQSPEHRQAQSERSKIQWAKRRANNEQG